MHKPFRFALIALIASSAAWATPEADAAGEEGISAQYLHPEALTPLPESFIEQLFPNSAQGWTRQKGGQDGYDYRVEVLKSGNQLAAEVHYWLAPSPDGKFWRHRVLSLEYPSQVAGTSPFAFIQDETVRARIEKVATYEQRGMPLFPFLVRQSSFASPRQASAAEAIKMLDLKQFEGYGLRRANTIYWFDAQGELSEAPAAWR